MNRRTALLLALFLALAVAAYFVLNAPSEKGVSVEGGTPLVTFDSASVTRISLATQGDTTVLERQGTEWFLRRPLSYRADQSAVTSLLHHAITLLVKNVVSTNPARRDIYQVGASGTDVRLFAGDDLRCAFVVGKNGPSFTETYVRGENSNDVVLVEGSLSFIFRRTLKEWRDRAILHVPSESIREIGYQYADESFVLSLKDSVWTLDGKPAKAVEVRSLLTTLASLDADDFADTAAGGSLRPLLTITYAGTQVVFFENKGKNNYLVHASTSPQWFVMEDWHVKALLKHKKDLL